MLCCASYRHATRRHQCAAALGWHRRIGHLVCHLYGHEQGVPKACPVCTAPRPSWLRAGSERVDNVENQLYPGACMDSDTTQRHEGYERTLEAFGKREIDSLAGTQMIAKGLDFPRVTWFGIVSAGSSLHRSDFGSAERTFPRLSQVASRANRSRLKGRLLIQTVNPECPAIRGAQTHDYDSFATPERADRCPLLPPVSG